MTFSRLVILFCFFISCHAISKSISSSIELLPDGSHSGILVYSLNEDKVIYQKSADELLPPASTLKLVTALTARLSLEEEFKFETTLENNKDEDLILTFSGDPSLTRDDLFALFRPLRNKKITGNLIIDTSIFTGYERAIGWPWDITGICYSAPSSALSIDKNCIEASISTKIKDGTTKVFVPEYQPIKFFTTAKTVTKEEKANSFCDLELTTEGNNYYLAGCLTNQTKPLPLRFAIQNLQVFTEGTLLHIFEEQGIEFSGDIQFITANQNHEKGETTPISSHQSKPLMALLAHMLKKSDNHYADNIIKMMGHKTYQQAGSFANGVAAMKEILISQANIDLTQAVLVDGSGLSRNNRMTVAQMKEVLSFIYKNDERLNLLSILPIAGINGTLQYRKSMRKAPIKGSIVAKSGSLFGSYNMAGFTKLDSDNPLMFVQFISDYHPIRKEDDEKSIQEIAPIFQFEKVFYQRLIELSER